MTPNYRIAGHLIRIESETLGEAITRIPGFAPFATTDKNDASCILRATESPMTTINQIFHESYEWYTHIRFGTTENGFAVQVKHDQGKETYCWLDIPAHTAYIRTDGDSYCLKMALWFVFGALTINSRTIAIHSSTICWNGRCVLFLGESGTGKSTHTKLWLKHIEGAHLLNDDSPILRVHDDGTVWVYGSPWSGKTPCYLNEAYPVAGLVRLSQAPYNRIQRLPVVQAFGALHPSCPPDFTYDDRLYDPLCEGLNGILQGAPVYHLACLPDEAAARLSHATVFGTEVKTGEQQTSIPGEPCGK